MSTTIDQAVIPTGTWTADTVHSGLSFEVPYAVATFSGDVPGFQATLTDGVLAGSAQIASLRVKDEALQAHLLSPEFFDAERHPEVSFTSTAIRSEGDRVAIDGDLTIKGVTKPVELRGTFIGTGTDPWGNERIGVDLAGTVDRTEFGVSWNAPLPGGGFLLPNDVTLAASFSAVKAA